MTTDQVFDINAWLDDLDKPQESQFKPNKFHVHFLKFRVDPALVVTPKKQTEPSKKAWKGFALTGRVPSAVKDEVIEYLGSLGEEYNDNGSYKERTVWKPALMLTTYPNTYLDRDTSQWERRDEPRERFYIGRNIYDPQTDSWVRDPNFVEFLDSCYQTDEDGNDVSALQARYGRDLWGRLDMFPDNTFVRDDDRTHNRWNSEEYQDSDGNTKIAPKYYMKITQVFETKEELEALMAEIGVGADDDDSESTATTQIPFPAEWAEAMSVERSDWENQWSGDARGELEAIKPPFRANHILKKMLPEWGAAENSDLHKALLAIAESI